MTADDFLKGVYIRRKESAAKERLGGGAWTGGILNTGKDGAGHTSGHCSENDLSQRFQSLCSDFFQFWQSGGEWNTILEGMNHEDVGTCRPLGVCGGVW